MRWRRTGRRIGVWLARICDRHVNSRLDRSSVADLLAAEPPVDVQHSRVRADIRDIQPRRARTRDWRRRVLLHKGALINTDLLHRSDACLLAILDTDGFVISWYDSLQSSSATVRDVVDQHVAQFYAPTHLAGILACRHLKRAASRGSSMQTGWRQRPGGITFWATTEIKPFVLRDGRVQGFAHVIRPAGDPRQQVSLVDLYPLRVIDVRAGVRRGPRRRTVALSWQIADRHIGRRHVS